MDATKLLRKYIQDKAMHYNHFRNLYLNSHKHTTLTSYEDGYLAGVCHALKEVNRDLIKDNKDAEEIVNHKIGTGIGWYRIPSL